jgi:hypothetical protein
MTFIIPVQNERVGWQGGQTSDDGGTCSQSQQPEEHVPPQQIFPAAQQTPLQQVLLQQLLPLQQVLLQHEPPQQICPELQFHTHTPPWQV